MVNFSENHKQVLFWLLYIQNIDICTENQLFNFGKKKLVKKT